MAQARQPILLRAHSAECVEAAALLDRFFDFTYAYRFGPQAHDVVLATLLAEEGGEPLSQAVYLPDRRAGALQRPSCRHGSNAWTTTGGSRSLRDALPGGYISRITPTTRPKTGSILRRAAAGGCGSCSMERRTATPRLPLRARSMRSTPSARSATTADIRQHSVVVRDRRWRYAAAAPARPKAEIRPSIVLS